MKENFWDRGSFHRIGCFGQSLLRGLQVVKRKVASNGEGCLPVGQAPQVKRKLETVGSDKLIDANRCAKVNITKG